MHRRVLDEVRDTTTPPPSFAIHTQPGSAQPTLVSIVVAKQLSTGERAAGASPVFVGLGAVGLIFAVVCVIGFRPRWSAGALSPSPLPGSSSSCWRR